MKIKIISKAILFTTIFLYSCNINKKNMNTSNNINIAIQFVEAINTSSIDKIEKLLSTDHIFIDSGDGRYEGKDFMIQAWIGYFEMFPDYKIEIVDISENDSLVGIFGYASGTYKGLHNETNSNYFRVPASWKAIVEDNKIKH